MAGLVLAIGALPALGMDSDVLLAAPALALVLPLLAGRYFGEGRLARLAAAFAPPRRRAAAVLCAKVPRAPRAMPRGGRLIATALATRPPPARALPTA